MSVTRTQVAEYLSAHLGDGREEAIERVAAWLATSGRTRDARYLARDTSSQALEDGYLYAVVTSAQALSAETKEQIATYLRSAANVEQLELEYRIDPARLGGVHLDLPDSQLDATLRTRLDHFAKGITSE